MRISDICRGMAPVEVVGPTELVATEPDFKIDFLGEHNLHNADLPKGSTKTMHLWTGEEGDLDLANAVLPSHTLRWYGKIQDTIRQHLWSGNWKRDAGLVRAVQRSFEQGEKPEGAE